MILFDKKIALYLKKVLLNECVDSILIASYGLGFQINNIKIHCNERVFTKINETNYEWSDSPNNAPWGSLVRQQVIDVSLSSPSLLMFTLRSGDYFEIETKESKYESVIIDFPSVGEKMVMEIY